MRRARKALMIMINKSTGSIYQLQVERCMEHCSAHICSLLIPWHPLKRAVNGLSSDVSLFLTVTNFTGFGIHRYSISYCALCHTSRSCVFFQDLELDMVPVGVSSRYASHLPFNFFNLIHQIASPKLNSQNWRNSNSGYLNPRGRARMLSHRLQENGRACRQW